MSIISFIDSFAIHYSFWALGNRILIICQQNFSAGSEGNSHGKAVVALFPSNPADTEDRSYPTLSDWDFVRFLVSY